MLYYRYTLQSLSIVFFLIYFFLGIDVNFTMPSCIYILLVNTYMLLCSKKNFYLFFISFVVLFCNYSIISSNYLNRIEDTMYTEVLTHRVSIIALNILSLFNIFLFVLVRWNKIQESHKENIFISPLRKNTIIELLIIMALIYIFFKGYQIPDLEGERGRSTPIYEYSVILFSLYYYYSGGEKRFINIGLFLVVLFSMKSFVFGGRIEAIQFILCTYIMLFVYKVSMHKLIIVMTLAFIVLSIIGVVRGELLQGNFNVYSILLALGKSGFALDTAYSAYYTSESFIYVLEKHMIDGTHYFIAFFKSIIWGEASIKDASLPSFTFDYVYHSFGGILPYYFYFYFGKLGILLSALLLSLYINIIIKLKPTSSGINKFIALWFVCNTFRWYLYSPLTLFRGVLILCLAYWSTSVFHKLSTSLLIYCKKNM